MFRFGGYTLDVARAALRFGEIEVALRPKTFALLHYLVENADRLVTKDELTSVIWPNVAVSDESLAHCVSEVRRAIGDRKQTVIKTVSRRGYRFIAPVSRPPKSEASPSGQSFAALPGSKSGSGGDQYFEPPGFGRPTIAVMAFVNLSDDPGRERLSDAITEDIITDLSRFSELSVIARNISSTIDIRQIGRRLDAHYVLEGSVRRSGDRVRITAQLVRSETGVHLWAERFDRDTSTALSSHDEVTRAIVRMIVVHVKRAEAARRLLNLSQTRDAYSYFVCGAEAYRVHLLDPARSPISTVRDLFQQSLAADSEHPNHPDHAHTYAMLARTWVRTFWDPVNNDYLKHAGVDRAYELAKMSVMLNAGLPIARFQLGLALLFRHQQDEALTQLEEAFALNPNDMDWQFGYGLALAGRSARAVEMLQSNIDHDPFEWPIPHLYVGQARYMLERYYDAILPLRRCAARITGPGLCIVYAFLAATHAQLGQPDEASAALTVALNVNPTYTVEKMIRALPYNDRKDVAHLADGLSKDGLSIT
jgi:adenylate cyclase